MSEVVLFLLAMTAFMLSFAACGMLGLAREGVAPWWIGLVLLLAALACIVAFAVGLAKESQDA